MAEDAKRLLDLALEDRTIEEALKGQERSVREGIKADVLRRLLENTSLSAEIEALTMARAAKLDEPPLSVPQITVGRMIAVGAVSAVVWGFLGALVARLTGASTSIGALVGGTAALLVSAAVTAQLPLLRRQRTKAQLAWEEMDANIRSLEENTVENLVLPEVRLRFNQIVHPPFSARFAAADTRGLRDHFDPRWDVPVQATRQLRNTLEGLAAGSVGIAGPRGVGKTTLIRAACSGRLRADEEIEAAAGKEEREGPELPRQGIVISAPVRYGAEDFVRFLFARLCLWILSPAPEEERRERALAERREALRLIAAAVASVILSLLVVLLVVGGVIVSPAAWLGIAVLLGSGGFLAAGLGRLFERGRRRRLTLERHPAAIEAQENYEQLRYLETRSEEWSGQLATKLATLARKRGVSRAAQAWTLPETIARYRSFLAQLTDEEPMVIGIDELDKMGSSAEARSFLNEMKSLFDQPHVHYLVSVSEDALSDFERRGQPVRDVFDSAFNDVIRVEYLSMDESELLLRRRAVGIPPPWPALFHCLAGGLPRESIRVARRAAQIAGQQGDDLVTVTLGLIADRVADIEHAATVIARRDVFRDGTQPVLTWLRELSPIHPVDAAAEDGQAAANGAKTALRARMQVEDVVRQVRSGDGADGRDGRAVRLERLTLELAAGWYHALTCFEFFAEGKEDDLEEACRPDPGGHATIELLARGHQDLSSSPALSWQTVTDFRRKTKLEPLAYPALD